jgi:hypothetical protein
MATDDSSQNDKLSTSPAIRKEKLKRLALVRREISMRSRIRMMIAMVLLLVTASTVWCLVRINDAEMATASFANYRTVIDAARELETGVNRTRSMLWMYQADPVAEHFSKLRDSLEALARATIGIEDETKKGGFTLGRDEDGALLGDLGESREAQGIESKRKLVGIMQSGIERINKSLAVIDQQENQKLSLQELRRAHLALDTIASVSKNLSEQMELKTNEMWEHARVSLSFAGRDQLLVALLLFFLSPFLMGFGPQWLLLPLERLKGFSERVRHGRTRHDAIAGTDEVARLSRTIQSVLLRNEESDHRKSRKIIEINKTLRAVVSHVQMPLMVVGRGNHVDIVSPPMAQLLGDETHHLEGRNIEEICFAPLLVDALEDVRVAEDVDQESPIAIETHDGRVENVMPRIVGIQDHQARIVKIVIALEARHDSE